MGRAGAPRAPRLLPPQGKAVLNHRLQEMMTHRHRILEIVGLRHEPSRNSSALGFQDISFPGSPPAPAALHRPPGWLWAETHPGLDTSCLAIFPMSVPQTPLGLQAPVQQTSLPPTYATSKHSAPLLCGSALGSRIQQDGFKTTGPPGSYFIPVRETEIHR